ncbi:MAG: putative methicillin resistance protein [Candidatus Berkelbacteria bacterium Athens1014_28]|uniref:Putative methicillin resistance protein n=1 Tax=Candidatus Berkelbacteria bacterium Athens1014_28 TaxID=2017145 RepID=A0A554LNH1_9BACT|nr:MAG: putative methicillin resistance protein [Candidatus Berkelbacteria bacterium Athens1014_28]
MASLFQSPEWEKFKLESGWQKSWRIFDILILEKKIPILGTMLYSPMLSHDQTKLAQQKIFLDQIKKIAVEENSIFFRMESSEEFSEAYGLQLTANSYKKSFEEMQPEHTLVLDLTKSEEEILAQMKQKGRYNIKVAEKYGVKIANGKIEDFYQLYLQTAKRQKITFRKINYFQKLIDILGKKEYAFVLNATNPEGKILASSIVSLFADTATYLFGGSSDEMREMMASYKLQWEIIKKAKQFGCKYYDFFGIASTENPKHPWAGVTRFKKQFGGEEKTMLGSWDLIFSPAKYGAFKLAEKLRRK